MTIKSSSIFSYITSLVTPLTLIGIALRILLTPIYYTVEYNMPYFPADEYGFTKADRLHWAPFAVQYLVNNADISFLANLKFDDGNSLYNERELKHMEDVKHVVQGALNVWRGSLVTLLILGLIARSKKWMPEFIRGLQCGGWWMIGLAASLGLIVGVGILLNPDVFWEFFTLFHQLFFDGNSWLFYYSDTLIRLFPIRFWQDAFLAAAIIALGSGLGLALGLKRFDA